MKKLTSIIILSVLLSGCINTTKYGNCIGLAEDRNPKLMYKVSAWNLSMAIIFYYFVVPPVIVMMNNLYCPVGVKISEEKT